MCSPNLECLTYFISRVDYWGRGHFICLKSQVVKKICAFLCSNLFLNNDLLEKLTTFPFLSDVFVILRFKEIQYNLLCCLWKSRESFYMAVSDFLYLVGGIIFYNLQFGKLFSSICMGVSWKGTAILSLGFCKLCLKLTDPYSGF